MQILLNPSKNKYSYKTFFLVLFLVIDKALQGTPSIGTGLRRVKVPQKE